MLTWINIDLEALRHNIAIIRKVIEPEVKIMGVVKANAYGHGLVDIAKEMVEAGVEELAVANIDEAINLRLTKVKVPILILGYVEPVDYHRAIKHNIALTITNLEDVAALAEVTRELHLTARVHLKVDTGMHRLGISQSQIVDFVRDLQKEPYIILEALYSHFAEATDSGYSKEQLHTMQGALFALQQSGFELPEIHMANSRAIFQYPESHFDMVRSGIALYGLIPEIQELRPVLSWSTKLVHTKLVGAEQKVGYGLTYETKRISTIGVIPIGYADGYMRCLSNVAQVLINGKRVPVIGRICMNQTILDITGVNAKIDDEVVLIGQSGHELVTAHDLARWAGTNPHEIVSGIATNIERRICHNDN